MKIVYEDKEILVCHKLPGQPVQSANIRCLDMCSELKYYLRQHSGKKEQPYLGIIHRLDTGVGGILVFAKDKKSAAALTSQITDKTMEKRYLARVHCTHPEDHPLLDGEEHLLEHYLIRDGQKNMAAVAEKTDPGAKKASLRLRCMASLGEDDLLHITLLTGRFHQIRCQLSYVGLPIEGDHKYGALASMQDWRYPCLYAYALSFNHPKTGKRMSFVIDETEIPFTQKKV